MVIFFSLSICTYIPQCTIMGIFRNWVGEQSVSLFWDGWCGGGVKTIEDGGKNVPPPLVDFDKEQQATE